MGNGDKQQHNQRNFNFHSHLPHQVKREVAVGDIPKGCLAVLVGQGVEPKQRFVVPLVYLGHPLFLQLLKEAEDEFGFQQKGNIVIPCHVAEFQQVQGVIEKDNAHHHHISCFTA